MKNISNILFSLLLLSGCASVPTTILTSAQQFSIVSYARVTHTDHLELTGNERVFVDNTFPGFSYCIMAYPYGQYNISWETPDGRTIKIFGAGDIIRLENAELIIK